MIVSSSRMRPYRCFRSSRRLKYWLVHRMQRTSTAQNSLQAIFSSLVTGGCHRSCPFPSPPAVFQQPASHRRRVRGFSLLEALVAMAIASISLGTLYRTVGQSSRSASAVQERVEAALVARSVLAGSMYAEDLAKQESGQTGAWRWRLHMQPEMASWSPVVGRTPAAPLPVAKVTVDVTHTELGGVGLSWTSWKPYRTPP